jgi:hypothetical protein
MKTYTWQLHDNLIASCATVARNLQIELNDAKQRITNQDHTDPTETHHASTVKNWQTLQTAEHMFERTLGLCD